MLQPVPGARSRAQGYPGGQRSTGAGGKGRTDGDPLEGLSRWYSVTDGRHSAEGVSGPRPPAAQAEEAALDIDSWIEDYGWAWPGEDDEAAGSLFPQRTLYASHPRKRRTAAGRRSEPTGGGRRRTRQTSCCASGNRSSRRARGAPRRGRTKRRPRTTGYAPGVPNTTLRLRRLVRGIAEVLERPVWDLGAPSGR